MVEMLLVGGIVGILLVILIVLLLVLLQRRGLAKLQAQQRAWERAQEARQQRWIEQQEKYTTDTAKKLMLQVEQLRAKWQEWEAHDAERVTRLTRQNEAAIARLRIESEVARLPRVEDMPLPTNEKKRTIKRQEHRQPPCLQGEDLSGRDLSYRYLAQADLRNAQLANANLFMADLSGARLAGANLTGADLSAANLTRADLRGANLTETNVLVSDLKQAILTGTDLRKARNLSRQQLNEAIIDHSTQFDSEIANALQCKSSVLTTHNHAETMSISSPGRLEKPETPQPTELETPLPSEPETPLPELPIKDAQLYKHKQG